MKAFLYKIISIIVLVLGLIILEGACFRLVENYAKFRLKIAWGEPGEGAFNSYLKKIPLDHFAKLPDKNLDSSERAIGENQYATSVMSFGRPMRDRLLEEQQINTDPLSNFAIKNIGELKNVILPGLTKPAREEHIKLKLARRIDDPLEFAKALLIRVVHTEEKHLVNAESIRLENIFKLVLERGIACVVLPVFSSDDLLQKTEKFRKAYPTIAENIYLWGDHSAADFILESTHKKPSLYKSIIVNNPQNEIHPPKIKGMPWLLIGLPKALLSQKQVLESILLWIDRGRDADKVYPSRLGGLLKVFSDGKDDEFESFALSYLFIVQEYVDRIGGGWPEPKPLWSSNDMGNPSSSRNEKINKTSKMTLFEVEEELQKIQTLEELTPNILATFDCEIVRGYRQLHAGDPNLKKVTNRDLVLKLGLGFENMGGDVLEKIGEQDPLFLRFYKSLKEVQDSPLH